MDQMFRRKADADGIGADRPNGFRPSENPVSSVLAMSVGHSLPKQIAELFAWDPTEPVATRPMFMQYRVPGQTYALFYTHDGNKNVSEVVHFSRANGVAAHYEYAPFGEVTAQVRQGGVTAYDFSVLNPWRFSSEYADNALSLDYYNYRHYEPVTGRWLSRDPIEEPFSGNLFSFVRNRIIGYVDKLGLSDCCNCNECEVEIIRIDKPFITGYRVVNGIGDKTLIFKEENIDDAIVDNLIDQLGGELKEVIEKDANVIMKVLSQIIDMGQLYQPQIRVGHRIKFKKRECKKKSVPTQGVNLLRNKYDWN